MFSYVKFCLEIHSTHLTMPCLKCLFHMENHIELASIVIFVERISRQTVTWENIWKKVTWLFLVCSRRFQHFRHLAKNTNIFWHPVNQPPSWWPAACSSQSSTISSKTSTTTRSKLLPPSWLPAAYSSWPPTRSYSSSPTTRPQLLSPSWWPATCSLWPPADSSLTSPITWAQLLPPSQRLAACSSTPPPIPSSLTLPHHRPHTHKLRHRRGRRKGGSTVATIGRGWAPTGKLQYISGGRKCSQCSLCPRPADAVTQD